MTWYKGRDRGPRSELQARRAQGTPAPKTSGPEISGHAPWGIGEGSVGGETQSVSAVRQKIFMNGSPFMKIGIRHRLLALLPPETAHQASLWALQSGLGGRGARPDPRLGTRLWGQSFPSPLGMAAGFDKDGQVIAPLLRLGFGFVEVGTVTPEPQPGNPRPRVFRAPAHRAVVNRYGFNSAGHAEVLAHLRAWRAQNPQGILGVNLGMNRAEPDPLRAYVAGIKCMEAVASYLVVNLSSPNTQGLRDQQTQGLAALIQGMKAAQSRPVPLLAKVAPDLSQAQIETIATTALAEGLDGLIVANTTLDRPDDLPARFRAQAGGLSGAPLRAKALATLRAFYAILQGRLPLIGVGGILNGADAVARLRVGADLIQGYTGFTYRGTALIEETHRAIRAALDAEGLASPADLKGRPG